MRQRNHRDRAPGDESAELTANKLIKPGLAQESLDRQLADRYQNGRLDQRQLPLQPRRAIGYLSPARLQVSPLPATGKALHHRGHVAE